MDLAKAWKSSENRILTAAILLLNRWHRIPGNEPFSGRSWGGPQDGPKSFHEKQNSHCRPVCICQKFCREAGAVLTAQFSQSDASSPKSFLDILSSILFFWALKWCFDSLGPLKSLIWKRNGLGKSLEKLRKSDFDGCNPAIKPLT